MSKITFEIKGVKDTIKYLKSKKSEINDTIDKSLTKSSLRLVDEIKASIEGQRGEPRSVDVGTFLNSVSFNPDNCEIFSVIPYSEYLEYGTVKIDARRHFSNSLEREKGDIISNLQNALNKIK